MDVAATQAKLRALADELDELLPLIETTEAWASGHPDEFAPKLTLQSLLSRRAELEHALMRALSAQVEPVDAPPQDGNEAATPFAALYVLAQARRALCEGHRQGVISEEDLLVFTLRIWLGEPTAAVAKATGRSERETLRRWQRIVSYLVEHTEPFREPLIRNA